MNCNCLLVFSDQSLNVEDSLNSLEYPSDKNYLIDGKCQPTYSLDFCEKEKNKVHVKADFVCYNENYLPDIWIVDLIYLNFEKIRNLNPIEIIFTFSYIWEAQCNTDFKVETVQKIAAMNASLCILRDEMSTDLDED